MAVSVITASVVSAEQLTPGSDARASIAPRFAGQAEVCVVLFGSDTVFLSTRDTL